MKHDDIIDAVIAWVDSSDPEWLSERSKYVPDKTQDGNANRFRDWGILKYWFRGIEQYANWFNKIYFVTWGHIPSWLDTSNPKLVIVNHKDFIPEKYLPTFNDRTIELNLHRIQGLSERFVYFNDDMFLLKKTGPEAFFQKGLPCDMAVLRPISYDSWSMGLYTKINELIVIGRNFDKDECIKKNFFKFFTPKYGIYLIENILNMFYHGFTGFRYTHCPYPYLKRTFYDVWNKEYEVLDKTCSEKFRSNNGVNTWLFKQWQICKGDFVPKNEMKFSKTLSIVRDDRLIQKYLITPDYNSLCISDDEVEIDYEKEKAFLQTCFERVLPQKSSFEI